MYDAHFYTICARLYYQMWWEITRGRHPIRYIYTLQGGADFLRETVCRSCLLHTFSERKASMMKFVESNPEIRNEGIVGGPDQVKLSVSSQKPRKILDMISNSWVSSSIVTPNLLISRILLHLLLLEGYPMAIQHRYPRSCALHMTPWDVSSQIPCTPFILKMHLSHRTALVTIILPSRTHSFCHNYVQRTAVFSSRPFSTLDPSSTLDMTSSLANPVHSQPGLSTPSELFILKW